VKKAKTNDSALEMSAAGFMRDGGVGNDSTAKKE